MYEGDEHLTFFRGGGAIFFRLARGFFCACEKNKPTNCRGTSDPWCQIVSKLDRRRKK
jgi:hypothetical protein